MRIQITARHTDLSEAVRRRAEERLARLTRFEPRLSAVEVVFEEQKQVHRVEAILHVDGVEPLVASSEDTDAKAALDRLTDKLSRRLRRRHDRSRDHQAEALKGVEGD